ncbi:MAG: hypothetical protein IPI34_13580 [bacterium]|nr:hypothetical protein [bacterium]
MEIPRPCIDVAAEGYNVEWSQELRLDESLRGTPKTTLLIAVLRAWEPVRAVVGEPGGHVFELSCGYDLAGVRSAPMAAFLDRLGDAGHLMTRHGLDVTVKLNPTLLGADAVAAILHDRLGYRDAALVPQAFAEDLVMDRALELVGGLADFARAQGRRFGIKLTNTLVVANARGRLPGESAPTSRGRRCTCWPPPCWPNSTPACPAAWRWPAGPGARCRSRSRRGSSGATRPRPWRSAWRR